MLNQEIYLVTKKRELIRNIFQLAILLRKLISE